MGTEHREWSGENNECEYPYDLTSKQNKKLSGVCDTALSTLMNLISKSTVLIE